MKHIKCDDVCFLKAHLQAMLSYPQALHALHGKNNPLPTIQLSLYGLLYLGF